jgi:hypothetical protein
MSPKEESFTHSQESEVMLRNCGGDSESKRTNSLNWFELTQKQSSVNSFNRLISL